MAISPILGAIEGVLLTSASSEGVNTAAGCAARRFWRTAMPATASSVKERHHFGRAISLLVSRSPTRRINLILASKCASDASKRNAVSCSVLLWNRLLVRVSSSPTGQRSMQPPRLSARANWQRWRHLSRLRHESQAEIRSVFGSPGIRLS